jgi:hypothetical protein
LGLVTITHPHHPLCGQQVTIVSIRRGRNPDLVVCLPDGSHAAVGMSLTDYGVQAGPGPVVSSAHLLSLPGLRQIAQLIERCRQKGYLPAREP